MIKEIRDFFNQLLFHSIVCAFYSFMAGIFLFIVIVAPISTLLMGRDFNFSEILWITLGISAYLTIFTYFMYIPIYEKTINIDSANIIKEKLKIIEKKNLVLYSSFIIIYFIVSFVFLNPAISRSMCQSEVDGLTGSGRSAKWTYETCMRRHGIKEEW